MEILIIFAVILVIVGFARYNALRKKWAGIIGVGGSYLILIGVMCLVMLIGEVVNRVRGSAYVADSTGEVVMTIVVVVLCALYTAYVMIARCKTVGQRIMLPIVACLIGGGFCFRALASLVFHIPMESGEQETPDFPQYLYDSDENPWELMNSGSDNANYYCQKTGETRTFYISDFASGSPAGFHRR